MKTINTKVAAKAVREIKNLRTTESHVARAWNLLQSHALELSISS